MKDSALITKSRRKNISIFLSGCVIGYNALAFASEGQSDLPSIEEVLVTAQKKSEKLMDVPMSISAASGEQMKEMGITQVGDLEKIVPGFTYQPSYFGTPVFTLRGVGFQNPSVAAPPAVSVYIDQTPIAFPAEARGVGLDIARVEVLKGPQGTLFGQNSTGGAINYIANRPTEDFEAKIEVGAGNFDSYSVEGVASGRLTSNLLGRVALQTVQRGDWQKSTTRDDELGERDFVNGRVSFDWSPSDNFLVSFNYNGWRDKSDTQAPQFVKFTPPPAGPAGNYEGLFPVLSTYTPQSKDNRSADWDPDLSYEKDDKFDQFSIRVDWVHSLGTITSITSYADYDQSSPVDGDGTFVRDFYIDLTAKVRSFSQELRLSGDVSDGTLEWMLGANYALDRADERGKLLMASSRTGFSPFGAPGFQVYDRADEVNNQRISTSAIFANLDYQVTDTFGLTASIRYTDTQNDFEGCLQDVGDGNAATYYNSVGFPTTFNAGDCVTIDITTGTNAGLIKRKLYEDNTSWRVGADWYALDSLLLYANISKGYKAGSYATLPYVFSDQVNPVVQEELIAYEAGFKATVTSAVQVTGATYYYDYANKQLLATVPTFFGPLPGLATIPDSEITGAELSTIWQVTNNLRITAGANYTDSKVSKSLVVTDPGNNPIDIENYSFPVTPNWQTSLDVQYFFSLSDYTDAYVGLTSTYRSQSQATFGGGEDFEIAGYSLLDLRAGLVSVDDAWKLELWARNITDKDYVANATHFVDADVRVMGMPRTFGVRFTRNFF